MKARLQKSAVLKIRMMDFCYRHCLFAMIMLILLLTFFASKGQGINTIPQFETYKAEITAGKVSAGKTIHQTAIATDHDWKN